MKTQNVENKLKFDKSSISELNDTQMLNIGGEGSITFSYEQDKKTNEVIWISIQW